MPTTSPQLPLSGTHDHYLKTELYRLVREDPAIFDFLQNGSLDGVWYWDLEQAEHEWMSPRFWEVFGHQPEAQPHLASAWQEMINPDDFQVALANFHKHCEDPTHPYDQVVRYRHKNGSTVWVRCRGLAIRDPLGKPIRMLGAHTDITFLKEHEAKLHREITARKQAETALQRYADDLARSNKELNDFAYVVSHDLKAPLRAIDHLAQWIAEDAGEVLPDASLDDLSQLRQRVGRMAELLDSLLAYSRISRGQTEPEIIDTGRVVQDILAMLEIPEAFTVSVASDLPTLQAPKAPVELVLRNLIGNTLKHHDRADGCLQISGRDLGDEVEFIVADDGPGIPPAYHAQIFEMFQTLKPRDQVEGSGMGLAFVKKTVEHHSGTIDVESEENHGARFRVTWPKHDARRT